MVRHFACIILMVATAGIIFPAVYAHAAVDLRFSPADTTIAPGTPGRLAVYVDQVVDLRTIEITVSYDTTFVTSVDAGPGALFTESGYFLWSDFEEDDPGLWHGYTVIMGAGEYITGPGELFFWDVTGNQEGTSPVTVQEVRLFSPDGSLIFETSLPATSIIVDQVVPAYGVPMAFPGNLTTSPNPFNPRTNIQFELPEASPVFLAVYDARGRQVTILMDQFSPAGHINVAWDGKNSAGSEQPGGVYFFRMESDLGMAWAKAVLIK